ncbi:MAG TPA: glycosyltransferase family 4 protein [Thermoanaerobaculia bacterium]
MTALSILDVVVRFHPYIGGVENTVLDLNRRLLARGHRVKVVCADEPAGSPSHVQGIDVVRLPWKGKLGNTNLAWGLRKALRREKPDLIHTHIPTALYADAAADVAQELGVPLVLTYHNDLIGEGLKGLFGKVYNRFILPGLLARCDRVVTINPNYAAKSPHLSAGDPKITCVPWGVDEALFHPPADGGPAQDAPEMVLGFLSLLDEHHRYKGLEVLLKAVAELKRAGLRFRLRVGGAGEEQGFYRQLAAEQGVAGETEFLGFIPGPDLPAFYGSCHAFVLPSTDARREGFGLVLLEAMACGRAVVTTPIVGMATDIEQRGAGLLVKPEDPGDLAAGLRRLYEERGSLPGMGSRGRKLVEDRFTWTRVTDAYESIYLDAVAERRSGASTTSSSK